MTNPSVHSRPNDARLTWQGQTTADYQRSLVRPVTTTLWAKLWAWLNRPMF